MKQANSDKEFSYQPDCKKDSAFNISPLFCDFLLTNQGKKRTGKPIGKAFVSVSEKYGY